MSERELALNEVLHKASGLFRYVDIAMEFLQRPWQRPLQNRLKDLPAGLEGLYLQNFQQTDIVYQGLLKTALTWTILAEGAIRVPEIMDAYSGAYKQGDYERLLTPASDPDTINLHVNQIRKAGGIFLDVAPDSQVISLRHETVKDFFLHETEPQPKTPSHFHANELCQNCKGHLEAQNHFKLSEKHGHLEIFKTLRKYSDLERIIRSK